MKYKHRCNVMGCQNVARQRYEDIDIYFCRNHMPCNIFRKEPSLIILKYVMKNNIPMTFIPDKRMTKEMKDEQNNTMETKVHDKE